MHGRTDCPLPPLASPRLHSLPPSLPPFSNYYDGKSLILPRNRRSLRVQEKFKRYRRPRSVLPGCPDTWRDGASAKRILTLVSSAQIRTMPTAPTDITLTLTTTRTTNNNKMKCTIRDVEIDSWTPAQPTGRSGKAARGGGRSGLDRQRTSQNIAGGRGGAE
eukprot:1510407-Rhodomonas_salina.1